MELSHTYISNNEVIGKHVPEWIKNRRWNLKPMWATEHALVDPGRYQFMPRGWKPENRISAAPVRLWGRMPVSHRIGAGVAIVGGGSYGVYEIADGDR